MRAQKIQKKNKKSYKKKLPKETSKQSNEIYGIIILSFGVLIFMSFYFENSIGQTGVFIKDVISGLMGITGYLMPVAIIIFSMFLIFTRKHEAIKSRIIYIVILLFCISSYIETGYYRQSNFINMTAVDCMVKFYHNGQTYSGGGVFGGIIAVPLITAFKVTGTIVIITAVSLIDIILLTNISLVELSLKIKNVLSYIVKHVILLIIKILKICKYVIPCKSNENKEKGKILNEHQDIEDKLTDTVKPRIIDFRIEKESREKQIYMDELPFKNAKRINKENENKILRSEDAVFEYRFPPINLLHINNDITNIKGYRTRAIEKARILENTLKSFGVSARVVNICRGPAVTRYELQPSAGIKVSRIVNLSDDISLNLASSGVRIEAPIPGKAVVGVEVPNREITPVLLREVLESSEYEKNASRLTFALGKDITGQCIIADIDKMPHLLIAGATGAGKSVCINSLIISILYKSAPDEVKLILIDPKVVELGIYNGIPHLLIPVVTDPAKAAGALNWAVQEMEKRYKLFAENGVREIDSYNELMRSKGTTEELIPKIVIVIDELSDLMMLAPNDVENAICRIAQMARAAGMHLVIATQRPSVNVITGVIKANIPSRISFAVSSQVDSRTILDTGGAEKLLGRGDMLFNPVGSQKPVRIQGTFVTNEEVERVVKYIKSQTKAEYDGDIIEEINNEGINENKKSGDKDELLPDAIETVINAGQASVSLIQRKYKVGYARAARIIDQMEARGIIGEFEGSKPRRLLVTKQQWLEIKHREYN